MRREEAENTPNVVTDTFPIQAQPIDVLFDYGVMHSFISVKLIETLGLVPIHRPPLLSVTRLDGKTMKCDEWYKDCPF